MTQTLELVINPELPWMRVTITPLRVCLKFRSLEEQSDYKDMVMSRVLKFLEDNPDLQKSRRGVVRIAEPNKRIFISFTSQ